MYNGYNLFSKPGENNHKPFFFKVQTFPGINKQHIVTMETYCKKLIRKEKVEDLLVR